MNFIKITVEQPGPQGRGIMQSEAIVSIDNVSAFVKTPMGSVNVIFKSDFLQALQANKIKFVVLKTKVDKFFKDAE